MDPTVIRTGRPFRGNAIIWISNLKYKVDIADTVSERLRGGFRLVITQKKAKFCCAQIVKSHILLFQNVGNAISETLDVHNYFPGGGNSPSRARASSSDDRYTVLADTLHGHDPSKILDPPMDLTCIKVWLDSNINILMLM